MKPRTHDIRGVSLAVLAGLMPVAALAADPAPEAAKPAWLGTVQKTTYDGVGDDLVTAGFGLAGLLDKKPAVTFKDPLNPTAAELRRAAIATTLSSGEGFGSLYGPGVDSRTGELLGNDGKVAGEEYLAFDDDGSGRHNSVMLVQVPKGFDPAKKRCLLVVPITGSAGLYKNITDIGFWGLQRDCAVAYTDKGLANGFHELASDTVATIDGRRVTAETAGTASHFTADLSDAARAAFLEKFPNRIAFKHAHSKQNPETTWGRDTQHAAQFAFYVLNQKYPSKTTVPTLTRANTTVVVTGVSNGGGAALYAGEYDRDGWFDGVVAIEPQVQVRQNENIRIVRNGVVRVDPGRPLVDYFGVAILYEPCAALATPDAPMADKVVFAANRCASLKDKGLLRSETLAAQARESLDVLNDYGWEAESDPLHASGYMIAPDATEAKYASDHGRFGVEDRLCGFSFAAVDKDGRPMPAPASLMATIFATGPGGAPAGAIDIVNDNDPTGPRRNAVSVSPSTGRQDYNIDGALCLRNLTVADTPEAKRVQAGIAEFLAGADLGGKPTIIVHGRADARVPVNFSSRPYLALNSLVEAGKSRLSYVEVAGVQHFGTGTPGYDTRYLNISLYHMQALDKMWAALETGSKLPPSQVVHAVPRGGEPGKAPKVTRANVTPIADEPVLGARISVSSGEVRIPE